jgi:hypothetical protein
VIGDASCVADRVRFQGYRVGGSNSDFLLDFDVIIHLNARIPDSDRAQVAGAPINQNGLRASQ